MVPDAKKFVPKPDVAVHKQDLAAIDKEIAQAQAHLDNLKGKTTSRDPARNSIDQKKSALTTQLNAIKQRQDLNKESRRKLQDEQRSLQASIKRRINALKLKRDKYPFKTVDELEQRIQELEQKIDGGGLKLVEERKALDTIASLRKARKLVQTCHDEQLAVDQDLQRLDALNLQLGASVDDTLTEEYEAINAELAASREEAGNLRATKQKLIEARNDARKQLDNLYNQRRAKIEAFNETMADFHVRMAEERRRREDQKRQQRVEQEKQRRLQRIEQEKEQADVSAYDTEIATCNGLLAFLLAEFKENDSPSPQSNGTQLSVGSSSLAAQATRQVSAIPEGAQILNQSKPDHYYSAGKKSRRASNKKKNNALASENDTDAGAATPNDRPLTLPLPVLEQFWEIGVNPPSILSQLKEVRQEVNTKLQWYLENQAKATEERRAKVAQRIAQLEQEMQKLTT